MSDEPTYIDGNAAITDSIVECLNTGVEYLYAEDDAGEEGMHIRHARPDGTAQGSHTQATGFVAGNLTIQLNAASDVIPRPGYIVRWNGQYFKVAGKSAPARSKNNVVRVTLPVEKTVNPVLTTLLSADGQVLATSKAGASSTLDIDAASNRTGGTTAFSIAPWTEDYPAAVVPAGLSINSSTGVLTLDTVSAGTYYIKVLATETLANKPTCVGVGFLILTATA